MQDYNAHVVAVRKIHEALMILRVRPDAGVSLFEAGQYATLSLRLSEPRWDGVHTNNTQREDRLLKRAYSFSCPILENGELSTGFESNFFEFYIALVQKSSDDPPMLTPRLFALEPARRLFISDRPKGRYTLEGIQPEHDVLFISTGTGEAPHNTMVVELLRRKHRGRIGAIVTVRYQRDLAYLTEYRELEKRFPAFRYLPSTTREAVNLDPSHPQYVGKKYTQNLFAMGEISRLLGWESLPENTHIFLCGNPAMIGIPRRSDDGELDFPEPPGMIEILLRQGFTLDSPRNLGNIHFEKFW